MFPSRMLSRFTLVELLIVALVILAIGAFFGIVPAGPELGTPALLCAHFVWKDPYVSLGGVDLSSHVRSATLTYSAESQDDTCAGDDSRNRLGGLKDWSLQIEFAQDHAASQVDATLFSLVGTSVAVEVRPTDGSVSATNPKYTGNAVLESYQPFGGTVGQIAVAPVTFQGNGDLARATS